MSNFIERKFQSIIMHVFESEYNVWEFAKELIYYLPEKESTRIVENEILDWLLLGYKVKDGCELEFIQGIELWENTIENYAIPYLKARYQNPFKFIYKHRAKLTEILSNDDEKKNRLRKEAKKRLVELKMNSNFDTLIKKYKKFNSFVNWLESIISLRSREELGLKKLNKARDKK